MTILNLFKACKINLTNANISRDDADTLTHEFEITPKQFLNYSKQDFKASDQRGNINALTNAKRAIDCQTDKILTCFGFDIKGDLPKINNEYIVFINPQLYKTDLPHKLKLLQALDFAPASIIADVRTIRNKLEHEYEQFSNKDVQNAIQLADLFINATDSKLKMVWAYRISDEESVNSATGSVIDVRFKEDKKLSIEGFNAGKRYDIELTQNDIEFYAFLKLTYSFHYDQDIEDYFKELIAIIKHPIPSDHIRVENI